MSLLLQMSRHVDPDPKIRNILEHKTSTTGVEKLSDASFRGAHYLRQLHFL